MFIRNLIVVAALSVVACDPESDAAGRKVVETKAGPGFVAPVEPVVATMPTGAVPETPTGASAGPETPTTAPVVAAEGGAVGGAGSEFSQCLLACDAATLNHADKATCRYNCDRMPAKTATGVVDSDPVEYVVRCFDRCAADGKGETCLATCKQAVASAPAAPSAAVLDTLGSCLGSCRASKVKETDHATCDLNCAQAARSAGPGQRLAPVTKQ